MARSVARSLVMALVLGSASVFSLAACEPPQAKMAKPTKPIPEGRALEIIRKGVRAEKLDPTEGRDIDTDQGVGVHVDVGIDGKKFGIAYLTPDDLQDGKEAKLPKKDGRSLILVRGAGRNESDTLVVLFFENDYLYDDHTNASQDATQQAAEGRLERDVRDFVARAKIKKFP